MSIRKIIILAAIIAIPFSAHAAQKTITVGTSGSKASLDTNFGNAHDNFTELFGNVDQGVKTTDNPSFASVHASGGNLAAANKQVTKAWMSSASVAYTADVTSVIHGGHHWICKLSHTSNATGAEPGVGGSWATYWKYSGEVIDASGFNGNLATTDDTLQEVAQKLDDLSVSGSMTWPSVAGIPYWTSGTSWGGAYTLDTDLSTVSASDDSIPSAKATKAALDGKQATLTNPLTQSDIDDTPSDGNTTQPASSNSVFNGLALKLDKSGGTLTGTLTAPAFESSAADGAHYIATPNTVTLTSTATLGRAAWLTDRWWLANGTNWTTDYLLSHSLLGADSVTFTNKTLNTASTGNDITVPYELPATLVSPADTDDPLIDKVKRATTLTGYDCVAIGGGTISVDIQECDADGANCATTGATTAACGATNTNDATLTDTAIASGAWLKMVVGAPSGTVSQVSVKLYGTQTW